VLPEDHPDYEQNAFVTCGSLISLVRWGLDWPQKGVSVRRDPFVTPARRSLAAMHRPLTKKRSGARSVGGSLPPNLHVEDGLPVVPLHQSPRIAALL
jgi:hypothetical protein